MNPIQTWLDQIYFHIRGEAHITKRYNHGNNLLIMMWSWWTYTDTHTPYHIIMMIYSSISYDGIMVSQMDTST